MYPTYMHPNEWEVYQLVVRASLATKWECHQYENIVGSKRKMGESSRFTGTSTTMRKSQSMRYSTNHPLLPLRSTSLLQLNKKISKIY